MTRIAGILTNLVPYHHARWEAFARRPETSCVVVELTNKDEFAVLEFSGQGNSAYDRVTLFPRDLEAKLSPAEIAKRIAGELSRLKPGCVCLNGYAFTLALGALAWCVSNRVPAVVLSESTVWDEPRKGWKEWLKSRVIRLCSSALVGGAPHADYMAELGMPRARIFTGYDVVDNDHFETGAEKAKGHGGEFRRDHNLPAKYFLACSRFAPKKNLARLIEAYARYRTQSAATVTPWDLVILGDGSGREALLELRSRLGLEQSVHLIGAKPYHELPGYYAMASAFIHASTTEQWGLVVNEAMASGLPVLVSNRCGCAPDLAVEGRNGFTFDPCKVEDIAQKMLQISTMTDSLPAFGCASREIIAQWSPRRFAEGLAQAIEVALSNPPPLSNWFDRILLQLLIHR